MFELKDIKKTYKVGDIETKALDGISVAFREKEFVAILGTSGSGKTTCLNIIGGLDRYDTGDLIIKGKSTKSFKDRDWDAYRNNSIGFIFQSYNLISHLSIIENVELGMTLSGVSKSEKRRRTLEVLEKVGLKEHLHKKPNQLSGGQMQRVAIARALANNPEILLCDEPTGALDTNTSIQIMDLIKEVAKDRLVIMVTHNPELAEQYADRTIRFQDGNIVSDTNPHKERPKPDAFQLKKTNMSFLTALRLSFHNITTKKGRTFLTAFASSIGIIGIAVILSLSSGFQKQIDKFQEDALSEFPIIISRNAMEIDQEQLKENQEKLNGKFGDLEEYGDYKAVYLFDPTESAMVHKNHIDKKYIDYLEKIDTDICQSIGYTRLVNMNLLRKIGDKVQPVSIAAGITGGNNNNNMSMNAMGSAGLSSYPKTLEKSGESYLEKNYDILSGSFPKKDTELVLIVDEKNRIDFNILANLGFDTDKLKTMDFKDIVGTQLKLIPNDIYYSKTNVGNYVPGKNFKEMYENQENVTLTIKGILRKKEDVDLVVLGNGIAYSDELSQRVIDMSNDSAIVKAQQKENFNIITMEKMDETTKENTLAYLGADGIPFMITLYPVNFDNKDALLSYLDKYNEGKSSKEEILYTDLAESITSLTGGIMGGITMVLIAFAGISLVVSLIMICIITYTSVLERTKEIGILKALGARKKDITRVFDAETFILGVFSGVLGVSIAFLLTFPINQIIYKAAELENVASLQISHGITLIIISTLLTVLGGHIPARMASKKDAVEALRSE